MNTQPMESLSEDTEQLAVVKIWETIQGEGPYAGTPAIFVRLAGCNLQCPACDTDYTSQRTYMTPRAILQSIESKSSNDYPLVVITGGEPFRQNLLPLLDLLLHSHASKLELVRVRHVQIETNGTYAPVYLNYSQINRSPFISIVCSPKTGRIHPVLEAHITALKYVVQAGHVSHTDGLPLNTLGMACKTARISPEFTPPIYIQPLDEQNESLNKRNLEAALDSCFRFGYRLCLQTHKIIGLE